MTQPHGGHRPGAGRKPVGGHDGETAQSRTVTLLRHHWHAALVEGDGNLSRGLRRIIDRLAEAAKP